MIKIIDDVISKEYQIKIKNLFLGTEIPWYFNSTLTSKGIGNAIGFGHPFTIPNHTSLFFNDVITLSEKIAKRCDLKIKNILFARAFMQLPSIVDQDYDIFHVDLMTNHIVFLYYVNDSDGDTVICDKKYTNGDSNVIVNQNNLNIIQRISPKQGRVVIFDGNMYHASGIPKKIFVVF